jgi:hypothetical protein
MIEREEVHVVGPEKATIGRYAICLLNLATASAQVAGAFFSDMTMVTVQHVMHKRYEREFGGIAQNYDNTSGVRSGSAEQED